MAKLPPLFNVQLFDNSGEPLAGGKIYTYDNGTTDNKTTFQDADEVASNTNPIILDSAGRANIYLEDGAYTFRVDTSADVTLYTVDDITGDVANAFGSSVQDVSANTSITTAQQNSIIVCTNDPTLALLAAAQAGEGFVFTIKNNGTGPVEINPNAAETIDGAATKDIAAGYSAVVVCDGTGWRTVLEGPTSFTGVLAIAGTSSAAAGISLAEDTDNGTDKVTIQAPASLAADYTLTLPTTDGDANDLLNTDGSGNLGYTPFLDEDDMSSDSASSVASQQSIKSYVDSQSLTLGTAQDTTSGTAISFTGIPAGTKRVTVSFEAVSCNSGSVQWELEIGDSGGLETSGYDSICLGAVTGNATVSGSATDAFVLMPSSLASTASNDFSGAVVLTLIDSSTNTWAIHGNLGTRNTSNRAAFTSGVKSLSGELTQLSVTAGGATFDAGKMNIMYE